MENSNNTHKTTLRKVITGLLIIIPVLLVSISGLDLLLSAQASGKYQAPGDFVTVDGSRIHVVCMGEGEPALVLLAGFGGDVLDWMPALPQLAAQQRTCAIDRLGQGWSDPMPPGRPFRAFADDLSLVLAQLDIEDPIIVGHSLGGAIAQIYAASYETRGVILVEGLSADVAAPVVAQMGGYQSLNWAARLGWLRPLGFMLAPPAYSPELKAEMRAIRGGKQAILQMAMEGAAAAESGAAELAAAEGRLSVPMLIVAAGGAYVIPGLEEGAFLQALSNLADRYPDAALVVFPDAHHHLQAEYPEELATEIGGWVDAIETGTSALAR